MSQTDRLVVTLAHCYSKSYAYAAIGAAVNEFRSKGCLGNEELCRFLDATADGLKSRSGANVHLMLECLDQFRPSYQSPFLKGLLKHFQGPLQIRGLDFIVMRPACNH